MKSFSERVDEELKRLARSKEIKINGEKVEAILIAGGPGFKIYSASGHSGFILVKGSSVIEMHGEDDKIVARYVNLRYQNAADQPKIKEDFNELLKRY